VENETIDEEIIGDILRDMADNFALMASLEIK
jgi:hypothetical protein